MSNAIVKISKRAKAIQRMHKNKPWKECIAQASREYNRGTIGAAKKKPAKKKKPDYHQTGKSNKKRDKLFKAKRPGKRKSRSGNVYYERRTNRSDKPHSLTGRKTMEKSSDYNYVILKRIESENNQMRAAEELLKSCQRQLQISKERKDKHFIGVYKMRIKGIRQIVQTHKKNIRGFKVLLK